MLFVQDVQPDVPASGFSVPVAEKIENFFFISSESHFGHLTS